MCCLLRRRKDLQEGVVVFPESEAVLVVAKVVRLPVMPVEPGIEGGSRMPKVSLMDYFLCYVVRSMPWSLCVNVFLCAF